MVKHITKNIQNEILAELFKAKHSIKIAVAWFTNDLLFQPLLLKLQTGVYVELITNKDEINNSSDNPVHFDDFVQAGGILHWNTTKQLLHDKFCIIDNDIVINGSYNWTNKAEYNDEIESVYYSDQATTDFFNSKFDSLVRRFPACLFENSERIQGRPVVIEKDGFVSNGTYSEDGRILLKAKNVKKFRIRENIISCDKHAFDGCDILEELYISESVSYLNISSCRNLKCLWIYLSACQIDGCESSNIERIKILGIPSDLSIPMTSNNKSWRFSSFPSLCHVYIPNSIATLSETFMNCENLRSIDLSSTKIQRIPDLAFDGCHNLEEVKLPSTVKEIGKLAFKGCRKLNRIDLPDTITDIGNEVFRESGIEKIVIPNGVIEISDNCFYDCKKLCSVSLPEGLKAIGNGAFSNCKSLKGIALPSSLEEIGSYAFALCSLASIVIPYGIKRLGNNPFAGNPNNMMLFSYSQTYFVEHKHIIENDILTDYYCLFRSDERQLIAYFGTGREFKVPNWIVEIGPCAFLNNKYICAILLPETFKKNGIGAFQGCDNLQYIQALGPVFF